LLRVYKAILSATFDIAKWLRYHTPKKIGEYNAFGDEQTDADLIANEIIFKYLKATGVVRAAMSKESPIFNELNETGEYTVTFDPIDGGTISDANYSVASIFAIWAKKDIIGCTGKEVVGAALSIYGSRTSILIYNTYSKYVEELTLI